MGDGGDYPQFGHGQSPESMAEREAVRCAADDRATRKRCFAHHVADEVEVNCVADRRDLREPRFKKVPVVRPKSTTESTLRARSRHKDKLPTRQAAKK